MNHTSSTLRTEPWTLKPKPDLYELEIRFVLCIVDPKRHILDTPR